MLVNLNGHTLQLVDVTSWPDYPGEWPKPIECDQYEMVSYNVVTKAQREGKVDPNYSSEYDAGYLSMCRKIRKALHGGN